MQGMDRSRIQIPDRNRSFLYKLRMKIIKKKEKEERDQRERKQNRTNRREQIELTREEVQAVEEMNLPPVEEFEEFVDLYHNRKQTDE